MTEPVSRAGVEIGTPATIGKSQQPLYPNCRQPKPGAVNRRTKANAQKQSQYIQRKKQ